MNSSFLRAVVRIVFPAQLFFALTVFLRGHNEPGGGFIAGLLAAAAVALVGFCEGVARMRKILILSPQTWIALGMLVALGSGLYGAWFESAIFEGVWPKFAIPSFVAGDIKLGTPFFFDVGVFLIVMGIGTAFVLLFEED